MPGSLGTGTTGHGSLTGTALRIVGRGAALLERTTLRIVGRWGPYPLSLIKSRVGVGGRPLFDKWL
jgi:hypothetical protein